MLNEVNMDFRIPGLPHSVVKHAQSTSVRKLIHKIENHPDRHALQRDLRQNQAFHPFSPESKKMIQDVGHIELFGLFETDPKTQCTACLSYWNVGIVYCTCGHSLQKETEANRGFVTYTMDFLSIAEQVIKKGIPRGHRCGKKPGDTEYYLANQLKKKCKKKKFQGIHDRFLHDQAFRVRMIEHHRDEEDLAKARMDKRIGSESFTTTTEGKLLDNQMEKLLDKQNSSNQPNQLQIQFVTDRDDLMTTCKMEETRPVPRRSMLTLFAENSVLQTERGDLLRQR